MKLSEQLKRWCGIGGGTVKDHDDFVVAFSELTIQERLVVIQYLMYLKAKLTGVNDFEDVGQS